MNKILYVGISAPGAFPITAGILWLPCTTGD